VAEPAGILGEIASAKRGELAARFADVSIDSLRSIAKPATRSLAEALARGGARFILEIKRCSPSAGAIRAAADPVALARGYAGVADALSVLCDRQFFGGSLDDLAAARPHFDGPILAKDFFIDPRQVAEARIAGADAILVMLSLLDDDSARAMITEAQRFGMDSLVEVHDEREMRRAIALGAPLIGINNRDLTDFSVDLGTTERLAKLAPDRLLVSESGIAARSDVERLAPFADAFLVGSSLMRAADPAEAARALVFGRIKLCGLRTPEDFEAARSATYAGMVLASESPRAVSLGEALRLASLHPRPVAVFRNAPVSMVGTIATELGLAAVQLHGDEDPAYVRALTRRLPRHCQVWKAVQVARSEPDRFDAADRLVFDSGPGGTGRTFDWALIRDHPSLGSSLIAGGIGAANGRSAQRLGAHAIDVGSSLDSRPGQKSPQKIAAFFEALRPASRERLRACA
jgi:indole-3-glycerol phosphate synthase/phosphoribosylanthranilate isomerase